MNRRAVALAAGSILIVGALAGCGPRGAAGAGPSNSGQSNSGQASSGQASSAADPAAGQAANDAATQVNDVQRLLDELDADAASG